MEESKRYTRLGLFVIVSASVLAALLFALGGRDLFQHTFIFETYFNDSIAGLELGAPVRFRGVPLGQVTQILTSAATYERDVPLNRRREYIVVRVKVNLSAREAAQMRQDAVALVSRGLRAQTQLAGITGQQYLALDFMDPKKYPPLEFEWTPKYTYLPSAPSSAGEIIAKAQSFLASLNEADIKQLGQSLNTLVSDLDKKLGELPVAELSGRAQEVLANADSTLQRVDRILARAPVDHTLRKLDSVSTRLDALVGDPALRETLQNVAVISGRLRRVADDGDLDRLVKGVDEAAQRLDVMLGDNQYDVRVIAQDLRVTADNLRALSETIKRYPAGVLVGGPPDKLQLPGGTQ
jgi:phospholipid/cholesterol/gamma-HCH transport system substrate-binding protein/paraquat-inducible protein B